MMDTAPDTPRYLHDGDTQAVPDRDSPAAETTAAVDVSELLARVAEQTEQLAEAKVEHKHAEAQLKKRTREVNAERKAHKATRERLEEDSQTLLDECDRLAAESRALEAEVARERNALTAVEEDLKRVQDRTVALEEKLKIASAQRRQNEA